jgi:hypothetical protein
MLARSRTRACQVVFEKSLHSFTDRSQNIDRLLFRGEGFGVFPFTFAFTVFHPGILLDWCLFCAKTRDENSLLSG